MLQPISASVALHPSRSMIGVFMTFKISEPRQPQKYVDIKQIIKMIPALLLNLESAFLSNIFVSFFRMKGTARAAAPFVWVRNLNI
jgi:hypothetical protein